MQPFEIATTPNTHFGWGIRQQFAQHIIKQGYASVVLISSRFLMQPQQYSAQLIAELNQADIRVNIFTVSGEPSPELVDELVKNSPHNAQAVIAIGGGSVLDAAKAIAGLIPSQTSVMNYLEGVGLGKPFNVETLPFYALPTTAGTGSETTKNAVLSKLGAFKKSFRDDKLLAKEVWLDPQFLETCPDTILYSTGMDAFTQLIESYTTLKSNPITDALAWQGLSLFKGAFDKINSSIPTDRQQGFENLMLAASLSGTTLANAGLGAVHGLAGPIGAFFEVPHGTVCACLLSPITQANIETLQAQQTKIAQKTLAKYLKISQLFLGTGASLEDFIHFLKTLSQQLLTQSLADFGLACEQMNPVIQNCRSGSMLGNPVTLTDQQLLNAIQQAL